MKKDKSPNVWIEPVSLLHKRKKKQRPNASVTDRINIAYRVLVDKEKQYVVAKEFNLSQNRVSEIAKSVRKNLPDQ